MNLEQVRATAKERLSRSGEASSSMKNIPALSEELSFNLQKRIALRNCGRINPENINHSIVLGNGYAGLSNALGISPPDLVQTSIRTALKGRRGRGCSTPKKWEIFAEKSEEDKCLICNAVDPDPKSRISRFLLENDPHSVLEGMLISAYATGASRSYLLVEEKTNAAPKLRKALDQMKAYNLHGSNILNSQFRSEIEILEIQDAIPTGYQVELLRCMDEHQPLPHILPVDPVSSALKGKNVLVVNPESMASLATILGNESSDAGQGSKVVTLTGSLVRKIVAEVPHGMTIKTIIDSLGGGVSNGKIIKAVQLGGPSGYFVTPNALNHAIGCNALDESCSSIGSGTIDVLDSDASILTATKDIMAFLQSQSCGKCVFCREGCLQMRTILEDIAENNARPHDLELLVELGEEMRQASLCDFGRTAPNAVLSGIELFRDEYGKRE